MFKHLALCLLFTSLTPVSLQAATLFAVVSDRSAAELAAGAALFHRQHPSHQLIFRSTSQLMELNDQQIDAYIHKADTILIAAVFGDMVARLSKRLALSGEQGNKTVIAFNSDQKVTRLSRMAGKNVFQGIDHKTFKLLTQNPRAEEDPIKYLRKLQKEYPSQSDWLEARSYWQARGTNNMAALLGWLLHPFDTTATPSEAKPQAAIRYYYARKIIRPEHLSFDKNKPVVVLLDHNTGDREGDRQLLDQLCAQLKEKQLDCLAILPRWGESSVQALRDITARIKPARLAGIISLQDFVIGGGGNRNASNQALARLNVPVIKGIRVIDRSRAQWQVAEDGLPWDSVHYRVAMPELQGISQPYVLATATPARIQSFTGLRITTTQAIGNMVSVITSRMHKWQQLQKTPNKDKRVAIVYYNHPPGRHNIGADNLDVPASLFDILYRLKQAGYHTGALPDSAEKLLDLIQQQGINLPEDNRALRDMADKVARVSLPQYQQWFKNLPSVVQHEMQHGPLGYLQGALQQAISQNEIQLGQQLLERVAGDLKHLLEGAEHPSRDRALNLFQQLQAKYQAALQGQALWPEITTLNQALRNTGIEGLQGWGPAPGKIMVQQDQLLVPGIRFGNIFIGPQPPRGWELNEELLHANMAFPPTHQYLAFYFWLQHSFKADALLHLGRHSTYEFLPRRRVGLTPDDYAMIIAGDIPGIYPYIVDGVGEGLQAKRRGLAVMIDHLTPPLATTPLYDELLKLRQLIESYESSPAQSDNPMRAAAATKIRTMIDELKLRDELASSMAEELRVRGIRFEQIDDELLVHEVGHYLTKMQEDFMPRGLHVFGKDWDKDAIEMMLTSMGKQTSKTDRQSLQSSPRMERTALLSALQGQYILPGKGNDPIRTPEALPTGRNFHALDGGLLPTRLGYELGVKLARTARQQNPGTASGNEAIVLWASDTVRDEGAMVAFGLDMLGIKPVWNSRGILKGLERLPLDRQGVRRDTVFTTSGLFRDLYGNLLVWLDRAVLLSLDGASQSIVKQYPKLIPALHAALSPLGELRKPGNESLQQNQIAAHWVRDALAYITKGTSPATAGRQASLRLFGDAPGAYGAGVNRLVERSGAWQDRREIARTYLQRMGHAYGIALNGEVAHQSFNQVLQHVENTYLGRSSNLYGLLDNNDAFDYLGGMSMAIETLTGQTPNNNVIDHANPNKLDIQRLDAALLSELRGQFLNPAWLKPLMQHGYAGARTMGSEFLEYLWGWQVTNPEIIKSWVWDDVKDVFIDDKFNIGLDTFLEQGHNVHVKSNMLALLLVAAQKDFWQADEQSLQQLAEQFAELVIEHGLPGSGHTRPGHPMLQWIKPLLKASTREAFEKLMADSQAESPGTATQAAITSIAEVSVNEPAHPDTSAHEIKLLSQRDAILLALLIVLLISGGIFYGRYKV